MLDKPLLLLTQYPKLFMWINEVGKRLVAMTTASDVVTNRHR